MSEELEKITLGAGCFWCVEAVLEQVDGVEKVRSGYMGGHVPDPTYEQIGTKKTGHVEVVEVTYDPEKIPTEHVLAWFWKLHDPTTKDRQGNDVGPQYRSAIFYHTSDQEKLAQESMKEAQPDFKSPIVTEIRPAETFYVAEEYHQNYYELNKNRNPYCRFVIAPKLKKLKLEE